MKSKILLRFAKKVSEVILVLASLAALFSGIYAVVEWVRGNITRETASVIEITFAVVVFFLLALYVIMWLVGQYKESVKEIESEQRYDEIARESRNRFEQQHPSLRDALLTTARHEADERQRRFTQLREQAEQRSAEARERMTT